MLFVLVAKIPPLKMSMEQVKNLWSFCMIQCMSACFKPVKYMNICVWRAKTVPDISWPCFCRGREIRSNLFKSWYMEMSLHHRSSQTLSALHQHLIFHRIYVIFQSWFYHTAALTELLIYLNQQAHPPLLFKWTTLRECSKCSMLPPPPQKKKLSHRGEGGSKSMSYFLTPLGNIDFFFSKHAVVTK